jgi:signal peptidase I
LLKDNVIIEATLGQTLKEPLEVSIQGDSMRPLIHDGDIVRVAPYPQTPIAVGDIVLFRREKSLVAHRVTAMKTENGQSLLAERGDNAGVIVWRPVKEVVGRVEQVRGRHGTLDLSRGTGRAIGRIMNLYWTTFKLPGRPKLFLILLLESFLKLQGVILDFSAGGKY